MLIRVLGEIRKGEAVGSALYVVKGTSISLGSSEAGQAKGEAKLVRKLKAGGRVRLG